MLTPSAHFGSGVLPRVTPPVYPWLHTATPPYPRQATADASVRSFSLRPGRLDRRFNLSQGTELGVDGNYYNTLYLCLAISGLQLVFPSDSRWRGQSAL